MNSSSHTVSTLRCKKQHTYCVASLGKFLVTLSDELYFYGGGGEGGGGGVCRREIRFDILSWENEAGRGGIEKYV